MVGRHIALRLPKREVLSSYCAACLDATDRPADGSVIAEVVRGGYVVDGWQDTCSCHAAVWMRVVGFPPSLSHGLFSTTLYIQMRKLFRHRDRFWL